MIQDPAFVSDLLRLLPTRVLYGPGMLAELGNSAKSEGGKEVLLVTDPGIVSAGHVDRAVDSMKTSGLNVTVFDGAAENPTTQHVNAGVRVARGKRVDFLIGLGGGSAMDCAKGINLILTQGGEVADYWGINKTTKPLLPMIAVPTTAGTGSEAQSFALISDATTHRKMACGDRRLPRDGGLRPRVAILDPELTVTAPAHVAAAAGIDAIAHAVETSGSTRRNPRSQQFSLAAWHLLEPNFERALRDRNDADARLKMLLGAHLAGAAIEHSMLGAAHACANPLTARFGIAHGVAVGLMLPHVVRFNSGDRTDANPYSLIHHDAGQLARRLQSLLFSAGLPKRLSELGVPEDALPDLAGLAAQEWTASFNPRSVSVEELLNIYNDAHS